MSRPRLLDLFSGAGGAARGYQLAGFHVTGVDSKPMPRYAGDEFIQADALDYLAAYGHEYDAIHASPPCQGYSRMRHLPWLKDRVYPMLIPATRAALEATGKTWCMENVEGAPMQNGITLCGATFGLRVYRHRMFESNVLLLAPPHRKHTVVIGKGRMLNRPQDPEGMLSISGHSFPSGDAPKRAMQIDWMTRDELAQAIPPAFTEYIGLQLRNALANREMAAAS